MRFTPEIESVLKKCGWYPGRQVWDRVEKWRQEFKEYDDIFLFDKAEETLLEFGGLTIKSTLPGIDFLPETIYLDPSRALGEKERWEWESEISSKLFPLGDIESAMAFLCIDESGRVYYVMDFIILIGYSIEEALENQIAGKWLIKPDFLN
jgi:hypothetical protein